MSGKGHISLGGFFLGAALAGALAALLTPFSGKELREKVGEKVDEVKKKAMDGETIAKTVSSIEDGINRLAMALEEAQKAADEKRSELTGGEK